MGIKGRRLNVTNLAEQFSEPQLVVNVDAIIEQSKEKGFLDADLNIDIKQVAKLNEIEISYETMESSQSGYLKNINDKWVIGVNIQHNPKRQRFTIAHELGHYFMHREKNLDFEDATFFRIDNSTSIEYAANEFAARLLMPEDRVRKAIDGGLKSLEKLADMFLVSTAAIKFRVVSLGYKLKENG